VALGYAALLSTHSVMYVSKLNARQLECPIHADAQLSVFVASGTIIIVFALSLDDENLTKYDNPLDGHGSNLRWLQDAMRT
jgi:hypothetical protein